MDRRNNPRPNQTRVETFPNTDTQDFTAPTSDTTPMEQQEAPQPRSRHIQHLIKKNDDLKRRLTLSEGHRLEISVENDKLRDNNKALEEKLRQLIDKIKQADQNPQAGVVLDNEDWENKYKALEERFKLEMATKDNMIRLLGCQISDLEYRHKLQREPVGNNQSRRRANHVQQLNKKIEALEQRLKASQNSLEKAVAEKEVWQNKYKTLEDKFNDKLAEKEQVVQDLLTKLASENQDWEEKYKAQQEQYSKEMAEKEQATQDLLTKLVSENQAWEERYKAQQEKFSKEMAEKEQAAQDHMLNLILENQECQEALQQKFKEELMERNQSWQTRTNQLEEENKQLAEKEQSLNTQVNQLEAENKELSEKLEKMERASQKLTETTDQPCTSNMESVQGDKPQGPEPKDMPEESREEQVGQTNNETLDAEPTQMETSEKDETEIKTEKQEQKVGKRKKKRNFLSRMFRKKDKKCGDGSNVEEKAAGCSSDAQLQLPPPPPLTCPPSSHSPTPTLSPSPCLSSHLSSDASSTPPPSPPASP